MVRLTQGERGPRAAGNAPGASGVDAPAAVSRSI